MGLRKKQWGSDGRCTWRWSTPVAMYDTTGRGNKPQSSFCLYSLYRSVNIKIEDWDDKKETRNTHLLKLSLCMLWRRMAERRITPPIFNLNTRWEVMVSFKAQPTYLPPHTFNSRRVSPRGRPDVLKKREISPAGIWTLDRAAHSLVATSTTLSWLPKSK